MPAGRDVPTSFLRVEGAVLLALATFLYFRGDGGWLLYVIVLLAPDAAVIGYLGGPRLGAIVYNVFHTYLPPAALAVGGILADARLPVLLALIWFAHIGMDRMFGFGLKHTSAFQDTHLGRIGRARETRSGGR